MLYLEDVRAYRAEQDRLATQPVRAATTRSGLPLPDLSPRRPEPRRPRRRRTKKR